jgi:hypothetical protein
VPLILYSAIHDSDPPDPNVESKQKVFLFFYFLALSTIRSLQVFTAHSHQGLPSATMASGRFLPLSSLTPKTLFSVRPRFLSSRPPSCLSFSGRNHSIPLNAVSFSSLPELQSTLIDLFQASPPTWKSAIGSNLIIFVLGSPILATGLSISGIGAAFLLGSLTWRAFGSSGFLLVASYFVLVS